MNIEIANRLVELRRERGLSQEDLAARLGVSRQAVSKWERCESSPDTDNLIALAKLYGVSLDSLLLHGAAGGAQAACVAEPREEPSEEEDEDEEEAVFAAADAWDEAEEANREARRARLKHILLTFPYPAILPFLYLVLGFAFGLWHPGWLIFLTAPLYYGLVNALL